MASISTQKPKGRLSLTGVKTSEIVLPGDRIESIAENQLSGHGTYETADGLTASSCGVVEVINKLISIKNIYSSYTGVVGGIVIGRILEIGQGRWLVDIGSSSRASLPVAAVALPGGEQRRKTDAEITNLSRFFIPGDIVVTEIQRINDANIILQMRGSRYGKLTNGCLVSVPAAAVPKMQQHMITLKCGVYIILGSNGMIWLGSPPIHSQETSSSSTFWLEGGLQSKYEKPTPDLRWSIALLRNIILKLAKEKIEVSKTLLEKIYDEIADRSKTPWELTETNFSVAELAIRVSS